MPRPGWSKPRSKTVFLDTVFAPVLDCTGIFAAVTKAGVSELYAIVETGGKQYKVSPGETVRVEKVPGARGDSYVFDKVLGVSDGGVTRFGSPYLPGMAVKATVVRQGKARKILVFKYKAKSNYRRRYGHRQQFTEVRMDSIEENAEGKASA
jgi:large subunit ribosomal protein L21